MVAPILIKGGLLVIPGEGVVEADVLALDGKIAAIGRDLHAPPESKVVDAAGLHVFPGFVDPHVHLGNYNSFTDDLETETRSAIAGGITVIGSYLKVLRHRSNPDPYMDLLSEVASQARGQISTDLFFHVAPHTEEHLAEIPRLRDAGITSFKFYIGYRGSEKALKRGTVGLDDGLLLHGYSTVASASRGSVALTHCEDEEINRFFETRLSAAPGVTELARARPDYSEAVAVLKAAYLASQTGTPLYVVHLSSGAAHDVVRNLRQVHRPPLYVEVTAHHLFLTTEGAETLPNPAYAITTPPLRESADVERLWEGVVRGEVDTVASDHCAISPELKTPTATAMPGFPGMETMGPVVISEGIRRGVPLSRLAELLSRRAAEIFGLWPRKGGIRIGGDADFALVRIGPEWTFDAGAGFSSSPCSVVDGRRLTARVTTTILRGTVAFRLESGPTSPSGIVVRAEDGIEGRPGSTDSRVGEGAA